MQPPIFKDQSPKRVAARMAIAFEMYEDGLAMLKAKLRHEHPDATPEQLQDMVAAFLRDPREETDRFIRPAKCPRFLEKS